ncbi:MAG: DegQ family serine endoprotease [Thermodesulfovibrionia bacterium]
MEENVKIMKRRGRVLSLLILIAIIIFFIDAPAHTSTISRDATDILTKTGQAMAEITEAVKPAVVNISTTRTEKIEESPIAPFFEDPLFKRFFGDRYGQSPMPRERKTMSLGSGVIVSPDGLILTNNHVIKNADKIKVILSDKREFDGKVIGTDPKTDLAVIKIDATNLPTILWGDSDKLRIGEIVIAIGNPYRLSQTVTMGIVSAVGRANVGIADYEDFIQTDAAINPGNSGGALVNARGELVGINTAIFSTTGGYQGIGFAIPSNMARAVMKSLIEKGKVIRGWLGVSIQPITPELAQQFQLKDEHGSLVADVVEASPADKAGIMRGDVIIEYDGKRVDEPFYLRNMVANTPPNTEVKIKIIRNGEPLTLNVVIGELPLEEAKEEAKIGKYENALKGVIVQNLTPDIYKQLNIPERIRGVVVMNIDPDSPSATRLQRGDVIIEINRKATPTVNDYERVVSQIKGGEDILLLVFRQGSTLFITIGKE